MGRAAGAVRAAGQTVATTRKARFDELFGAGRGLAGAQLREREREFARPVPFPETDNLGRAVSRYYLNNDPQTRILHREDGPAVEYEDGYREWWVQGQKHREDGPAVEWVNGTREWWVRGQRHREDGPAVEYADGDREWWSHGRRVSGPAAALPVL